jgi:hypothetical protein
MRAFSRFCAVFLIALAVSPVTAPFAACDLAAMVTEDGGTHCESKDLKDSPTLPTLGEFLLVLEYGDVTSASGPLGLTSPRSTAPLILRL